MQGISPITSSLRHYPYIVNEKLSPKATISRIYDSKPFSETDPISKTEIKKSTDKKLDLENLLSTLSGDIDKFEVDLEEFEEDTSDLNGIFDNLEDTDTDKSEKDIESLSKMLKDISNLQKDLEAIEKDIERFADLKDCQNISINIPISTFFEKLNQAKKITKLSKSLEKIKKILNLLMGILKINSKSGFNFIAVISRNVHWKRIKASLFKELHSLLNWKNS